MFCEFKKPYTFEGKEYKGLDIDFEKFTTELYEQAQRAFNTENPDFRGVMDLEISFHKQVLGLLINQPAVFFNRLPIYEFFKLKTEVQLFLTSAMGLGT